MEDPDKELQKRIEGLIKPKTDDKKALEEALMPDIDKRIQDLKDIFRHISYLTEIDSLLNDVTSESLSGEKGDIVESIVQYRKDYPYLEKAGLEELQERAEQTDLGDRVQLKKLLEFCGDVYRNVDRLVKKPSETKK